MVRSAPCYQHPARFASPRRRGDDCIEIVSCDEHLRTRHKSGLLSWQVGCEVLMKLLPDAIFVKEKVLGPNLHCVLKRSVNEQGNAHTKAVPRPDRRVFKARSEYGGAWCRKLSK
jgi:hypothetical protein